MKKVSVTIFLSIFCKSLLASDGPPIGLKYGQPYSVGGGIHAGLDLDVPRLTPVKSIANGFVVLVSKFNFGGPQLANVVMIRHADGIISRYLHIDRITVKRGEDIKKGEQFAVVELNGPAGFTGKQVHYPHLHLEIYRKDELIDPEMLEMKCNDSKWQWPVGCKD